MWAALANRGCRSVPLPGLLLGRGLPLLRGRQLAGAKARGVLGWVLGLRCRPAMTCSYSSAGVSGCSSEKGGEYYPHLQGWAQALRVFAVKPWWAPSEAPPLRVPPPWLPGPVSTPPACPGSTWFSPAALWALEGQEPCIRGSEGPFVAGGGGEGGGKEWGGGGPWKASERELCSEPASGKVPLAAEDGETGRRRVEECQQGQRAQAGDGHPVPPSITTALLLSMSTTV